MVKDIIVVKEAGDEAEQFLSKTCNKVKLEEGRLIIKDLLDTAMANNAKYEAGETDKSCCGLAANQIGYQSRVIIYSRPDGTWGSMMNPVLVNKSSATIESNEGCMSFSDMKTVTRYKSIEVMYMNQQGKWVKEKFNGFTAIEVQHEMDHLNGILI